MKKVSYFFILFVCVFAILLTGCNMTFEHTHKFDEKGMCSCGESNENTSSFIVTFDYQGFKESSKIQIDQRKTVEKPTDPQIDNYIFLGWYKDNQLWDFEKDIVTDDIVLTAKFKPISIIITFETGFDDIVVEPIEIDYNSNVIVEVITKDGYNFLGWYLDNELVTSETNFTKNSTLTAKWEEVKPSKYYVYFETLGGSLIEPLELEVGSEIIINEEPSKDYCCFLGWSEFPKYMPEHDITITSVWFNIKDHFELSEDGLGIKKYIGDSNNVYIPDYYYLNSELVYIKRIDREAFYNMHDITEVRLPQFIEDIAYYSFYGTSITNMVIPDGIKTIGESAFGSCKKLESVVIPNSLEWIGMSAFNRCDTLTTLSIPFTGSSRENPSCTYFGYIFGTNKYQYGYSTTIPSSLKTVYYTGTGEIVEKAFEGCKYIQNIYLSEGITKINDRAFLDCYNLRSIEFPSSLKYIGKHAFSSCNELSTVVLNEGLEEIDNAAFGNTRSLKEIYIPETVITMGAYIFDANIEITIYCKVSAKPDGWHNQWNLCSGSGSFKVIYGYDKE